MRIDFARLNHILIPQEKEGRDRFRQSRMGRILVPVVQFFWGSLTNEGRTLAFVTLLVGAFGVDVQRSTTYVLFSVLAGLLAASVLVARRLRLEDAVVRIDAPRRVTIDGPVTFTISVTRSPRRPASPGRRDPVRVRGPFLPWDGAWLDELPSEMWVSAPGTARCSMRARFIRRGLHHLDPFTVAAVAPTGLACGPRVKSDAVKLYVVPRIANVLQLPKVVAMRHHPGGVALASKSGEAMDLLGVRPYRPGDPARDLHARSWARTGLPVVREYQQEYFTRVGVVLDSDVADSERLEAAIELAAGVVAHLSRGEALVDVIVVGESVHELTIGRSLGYLDQALDMLATVERGPALRATELLRRLDPYLARLSSVVLIALSDGEEHKAARRGIERRGIACSSIVVDDALVKSIVNKEALGW